MPRASIPDAVEGQTFMPEFRPDEFRERPERTSSTICSRNSDA